MTDWSKPSDIHDSERTATTVDFGDCRFRPCVDGGRWAEVDTSKGTHDGRTGRGGGRGRFRHGGAGKDD